MIIPSYPKNLILGTALWGWGIEKAKAFKILDHFVDRGYRKIDVATNYPINGEQNFYGQTIDWLTEWIKYNDEKLIDVICKVGSLSNANSPNCNLSRSFLLTSKALISFKLCSSLSCLMIHWDNRSNIDEIQETSDFLMQIFKDGINVGLSGIANPKLYLEAAPALRDQWYIQIKENVINDKIRKRYTKFFPNATYQAYGINLRGFKLDSKRKSISTYLRDINIDNLTKEKILNKEKESNLKPKPKSIYDFFISYIYQNKNISEVLIAPSNLDQLKDTLNFTKEIDLFHTQLNN